MQVEDFYKTVTEASKGSVIKEKGSKFLGKLTETWDDLVHSTQMITTKSNA